MSAPQARWCGGLLCLARGVCRPNPVPSEEQQGMGARDLRVSSNLQRTAHPEFPRTAGLGGPGLRPQVRRAAVRASSNWNHSGAHVRAVAKASCAH